MTTRYTKDADSILDWQFDWSTWLPSGDTISARTVTVETIAGDAAPLTLDSTENDTTSVTAWLSAGTPGNVYLVTCQITTTPGARTEDHSIAIVVTQH